MSADADDFKIGKRRKQNEKRKRMPQLTYRRTLDQYQRALPAWRALDQWRAARPPGCCPPFLANLQKALDKTSILCYY